MMRINDEPTDVFSNGCFDTFHPWNAWLNTYIPRGTTARDSSPNTRKRKFLKQQAFSIYFLLVRGSFFIDNQNT